MSERREPRSYVLMTAMPPTKGHLELIKYAKSLAREVVVIVCTQPDEPYYEERVLSLLQATRNMRGVYLQHIHRELPQEPEQDPGFWDMWAGFLREKWFQPGDYIVASEAYGVRLAQEVDGIFMPFDIGRSITFSRATDVRNDPFMEFEQILPEFQPYLIKTATVFGAESTGKTTLSRLLESYGHVLPEWARPFLEAVGPELSTMRMQQIWEGQRALQDYGRSLRDKPWIIQDTDLFSTVGYWRMHEDVFGPTPEWLIQDAIDRQSDVYLVTLSNIPFEPDPLRYGGDVREGSDEFWIDILREFSLNYTTILGPDIYSRKTDGVQALLKNFKPGLTYQRITKETLDAQNIGDR